MNVDRIKALAKDNGKSITYLCQRINRPKYYLNDISKEPSRMISRQDLEVIANELETTAEYLAYETDMREKPTTNEGEDRKSVV